MRVPAATTADTASPSRSMASTPTPSTTCAPCRRAAPTYPEVTSFGPASPSLGQNVPPTTSSTLSCGTMSATSSRVSSRTSRSPTGVLHLDVAGELFHLVGAAGHEQVADRRRSAVAPTSSSKSSRSLPAQHADAHVDLGGELLAHPTGAARRGTRTEVAAFEQQRAHAGAGEVERQAAPHHPAADDHAFGAAAAGRSSAQATWETAAEPGQRLVEQEGARSAPAGGGHSSPSSRGRRRRRRPSRTWSMAATVGAEQRRRRRCDRRRRR